ncbi:MAG TPA: DUF6457 domain-containing protein [Solirubrobacteraceae bacterium]|nr:DUF6457 domain-containing protein [Solirubrobacteraceae bacterium]
MSTQEPLSAEDWTQRYAARLGLEPPSAAEVEQLLALAGVAAHASARQAAPISTWLAARAGVTPEQALTAARALAEAPQGASGDGPGH